MASPEIYRQGGAESGKWWRYGAFGISGAVLALAVINAVDLAIPRI